VLLYYITDRSQFPGDESFRRRALLDKIAEAAACGVDFIQLREKDLPARELESLARAAVRIIQDNSGPGNQGPKTRLLVNSRVDVAIACGADGVHLRSDDIFPRDVRSVWAAAHGDSLPIVAVSCHTSADVIGAASDRADFAVFAPVFEKKDAPGFPAAGLTALHEACQQNIPVLALGGINLANARSCIEAGAAGVAGIRLFQESEIAEVVRVLPANSRMPSEL
jgi:thiamine-phosphate pyrophosphorylase